MRPSCAYRLVALLYLVAASHRHSGASAKPLRERQKRERRRQERRTEVVVVDEDEPPLDLPLPPAATGSLLDLQFTTDPHAGRDPLDLVLDGTFALAALRYGPASFKAGVGPADAYGPDVYGEFCAHDPALDGTAPAALPTAAARAGAADHCGEHRRTLPLGEVRAAVRARDAAAAGAPPPLPVAGLLFHEGRAGAGLLAGAVAAVGRHVRVVAEHPALRDALATCDVVRNRYRKEDCDPARQRRLVEDVVALLARPGPDGATRLYLKLSSGSTAYLPALRASYPNAPWVFVYREADDALAKATERGRQVGCVKARRNPSAALRDHAADRLPAAGHANLDSPSRLEVCALHLASLLRVATEEHARTGTGLLAAYELDVRDNVESVAGTLLPYLGLGEEVRADPAGVRDRVAQVLATQSDTSSARRGQDTTWRGETVQVSEEVTAASHAFMAADTEAIAKMRERDAAARERKAEEAGEAR